MDILETMKSINTYEKWNSFYLSIEKTIKKNLDNYNLDFLKILENKNNQFKTNSLFEAINDNIKTKIELITNSKENDVIEKNSKSEEIINKDVVKTSPLSPKKNNKRIPVKKIQSKKNKSKQTVDNKKIKDTKIIKKKSVSKITLEQIENKNDIELYYKKEQSYFSVKNIEYFELFLVKAIKLWIQYRSIETLEKNIIKRNIDYDLKEFYNKNSLNINKIYFEGYNKDEFEKFYKTQQRRLKNRNLFFLKNFLYKSIELEIKESSIHEITRHIQIQEKDFSLKNFQEKNDISKKIIKKYDFSNFTKDKLILFYKKQSNWFTSKNIEYFKELLVVSMKVWFEKSKTETIKRNIIKRKDDFDFENFYEENWIK